MANASGKSNLVEVFRLLKKIYVDKDSFPFLEWWGYDNVVWQRKEEMPIIIGLLFDIEGYEVYFETNFTGTGGKFQIYKEVLDIRGYLKFEKEGEWLTIKHDVDFVENFTKNLDGYRVGYGRGKTRLLELKNKLIRETKIRVKQEPKLLEYNNIGSINLGYKYSVFIEKKTSKPLVFSDFFIQEQVIQNDSGAEHFPIFSPGIFYEETLEIPLYQISAMTIHSTFNKTLIFYPLNIRSMKIPQTFRREETIKEDGSNIASVYHTIYLKEGEIPEEIYNPLTIVFPKIDVRPHLTDDGRVMIKFFEEGLELLPPNTSDGFYKILTMLIAIYLKPPLLIVDEIENSLHPSTLELILNTIGIGDTQAIITTHSPVVVDMTELSNIILVEKEHGESKFKRIKDPEKVREFLNEKGITFSEGWIYGDLLKTEKQA